MSRDALHARALALITRLADGSRDDAARDGLLDAMRVYQQAHVEPYARLAGGRAGAQVDATVAVGRALPTDVFRFARVAAHGPQHDVATFRSSGTTSGQRGEHHLRDLTLYDAAAEAAARYALFPDVGSMTLLVLAPAPQEAPDSSLSYMLGRFMQWFGDGDSDVVWAGNGLRMGALRDGLNAAQSRGKPVALLGTSFAFVHADEQFADDAERCFSLPAGSRIMQTGGFKGRSRTLQPDAMLDMLSRRYGVPQAMIIQEYGMTELCSQMYETTLRDAVTGAAVGPRRLWVPGWVRTDVVEAETMQPVARAEHGAPAQRRGLLRIDDAANLDSVCAVQTSDMATLDASGLVVHGRAQGAMLRGCSLSVEEALGHTP